MTQLVLGLLSRLGKLTVQDLLVLAYGDHLGDAAFEVLLLLINFALKASNLVISGILDLLQPRLVLQSQVGTQVL
eukprot:CAMPEP_0185589420 /NCGR_PEP_ID=MMETSP0434-20130131/57029_1 /TAXON_ID=626734 ORGANISM="Favella taraikaensis, Strain Fe Narragansett Bay" /NCGR_SAMPLE_ID=MMETSP0434 /ASSEMBLY_ACC=CAM_ASM_000379 /LENGTH=74 /DNA_ID=CAMNT_0028212813 /DNA_START=1107 /DNA_END=1331 /DNA_ORIENTATION=-